ncbi:MAG: hypothetical protein R6U36_04010 [Candidatus Fermentibacteraceae bacterium]
MAVETTADVNGNGAEDVVASPHFGSGSGLYCVDGLAGDVCLAASESYPTPMGCVALGGFLKGLRGVSTSWPESVEEGEDLPPGVYLVVRKEVPGRALRAVVLPARWGRRTGTGSRAGRERLTRPGEGPRINVRPPTQRKS